MRPGPFPKIADAGSYDEHAELYARFIPRLAGPLADELVALAALRRGDRVLDVGCGTGLSTVRAGAAVAPSGAVLGVDLSRGMLDAASKRLAGSPHADLITLRRMDAEHLDAPEAGFDAVISLCAVFHFPDVVRALTEMRRVLVPGGRLVVAFGAGRPNTARALLVRAPRRAVGLARVRAGLDLRAPGRLMAIAQREAPAPNAPTVTAWSTAKPLPRLLAAVADAGFEPGDVCWRGHDVEFSSSREFWLAQMAIVTEVRKRLSDVDRQIASRVQDSFEAEADRVLSRGGRLIYPYGATYVTARRPL